MDEFETKLGRRGFGVKSGFPAFFIPFVAKRHWNDIVLLANGRNTTKEKAAELNPAALLLKTSLRDQLFVGIDARFRKIVQRALNLGLVFTVGNAIPAIRRGKYANTRCFAA